MVKISKKLQKSNKWLSLIDKGFLIGSLFGLIISILFWLSIFVFPSELLFAMTWVMFWISLAGRIILVPLGFKSLSTFTVFATIISIAVFGFIGYLLNLTRLKNKQQFKVTLIILIIFYLLFFAACNLLLTSDW